MTRYATPAERTWAGRALQELQENQHRVGLAPAPDPHFEGHMIHVVLSRNPGWYQKFVAGRWDRRGCHVEKRRVERALRRVFEHGRVRGNDYSAAVLKVLKDTWGGER